MAEPTLYLSLVSSDAAVRGTSGQEVQKRSSRAFAAELEQPRHVSRRTAAPRRARSHGTA